MLSHKERLVKFLIKELGGTEQVKRFSTELKTLGICDLSESKTAEYVMSEEGAVYLFTLVTNFQFGLLNKLVEIQNKIKGNK